MRKFLLLFLVLLLVACEASEVVETSNESGEEKNEATIGSETASENQTAPSSVETINPAKTAAEAGVVRERDWSKGAEDPVVTIIEYGDFQ